MEVRIISNHPSYAISENGNVYSVKPNGLKELKVDISNGYPRVKLDGVKEYVSKLVADAFLNCSDPQCRLSFIDGDRTNCRADNLIWLSNSEIQIYSQYTLDYRKRLLKR